MKATEEVDVDLLRSLAEVAMIKGFRSGKLEEAIAALAKYDSQQAGIALMRRLLRRLMSTAAEVARVTRAVLLLSTTVKGLQHVAVVDAARLASERTAATTASDDAAALAKALRDTTEGLEGTVATLETAAAADAESCRTMESDLRADFVAAHGTNDALQATVDEQQRAPEVAAERSGLAVRRLEDQLQSSRRDASQGRASTLAVRQELAACEDDVAEVDEASVALSLVAAESTILLGGGLQPATSRPAEVTTREGSDLSAANEARQRTW
ncbi:unnamed protein product [Ectocarpus sp. CCAP 1310/34]|nr:unnamed protein product [Ectocarpus sp. CCAP 1310/34]